MNKRKLNKVFAIIKEQTKMDYAITNADDYGDCNTCVNSELAFEFGIDSKGIYAKKWTRGMNASGPWAHENSVYIAHDITEDQALQMIEIFKSNGYTIEPETYNPLKCFEIKEKQK